MNCTVRSIRVFSRFLRRPPVQIAGLKTKTEGKIVDLENSFNKDIKAGGVVPVFRRALLFPTRVALQDDFGIYTYAGLYHAATELSNQINQVLSGDSQCTIAYMCEKNASHVIAQWAIWMTGNIAVPLTPIHPPEMLKYFVSDSNSRLLICSEEFEKILSPISKEMKKPIIVTSRAKEITAQLYQPDGASEPTITEDVGKSNLWYGENDALVIYTSGTTSKPKGVVWTHDMLSTQIAALHTAWQYSASDVVLHTLPLHHIHGQLNSLNASLAAGARVRMMCQFVSPTIWARLLGMGEPEEERVSVFHGVPTMYAKLLADYEKMFNSPRAAEYVRATLAKRMRLMCAGSAPLPESLFKRWEEISGVRLLERYGMSEVGMALSNPYTPVEERAIGAVGLPLPGVTARIAVLEQNDVTPLVTVEASHPDMQIRVHTNDLCHSGWEQPKITIHEKTEPSEGFQGELLLKGPAVFSRYLNRPPLVDSDEFIDGEWFRTGDTVNFSKNQFKMLGRTSIDIIKSRGYKISAVEVESAILDIPQVADAAVLGIQDKMEGEIVATVIVLKQNNNFTLKDLKTELGKKLAPYQLPRTMLIVKEMPRNVMGKLDKKEIRRLYTKDLQLTN